MSSTPLSGRIAVITGASAGIGEAIAHDLARLGASVVLNARRAERVRAVADAVRSAGGRAETVVGDAADDAVIEAMLDRARDAYGGEASLVVANAGRGLAGSPISSDRAQWEDMVRTNLVGAAALMRAAAVRMTASLERAGPDAWRTHAHDIVVISSNVGKHISPFSSMYGSTKFAITSVAEAMRRELAPRGVRVSAVHPGVVRSEFQQVAGYDVAKFGQFMETIGPVLAPEDVARSVSFIVSQPAHVLVNDVTLRPTRQEYP